MTLTNLVKLASLFASTVINSKKIKKKKKQNSK